MTSPSKVAEIAEGLSESERRLFAIIASTPRDMLDASMAPRAWAYYADQGLLTTEVGGGVTPLGFELALYIKDRSNG